MNIFRLEKWYFDVTTPEEAWIGYSARINCLGFQLSYAQSLRVQNGHKPHLATSFRKHENPVLDSSLIGANTGLFHLNAQRASIPESNEILFQDTNGFVNWHCIEPSTTIHVNFPHAPDIVGKGYVEKLTMTMMPWKLPINALIWGRFIGAKHSVVWIHWHHTHPQSWLFVNGKKRLSHEITSTQVCGEHITLKIKNKQTLITAKPFKEHTRLLGYLLPSLRTMHEEKWYAEGSLTIDGEHDYGSIIHEYVVLKHET